VDDCPGAIAANKIERLDPIPTAAEEFFARRKLVVVELVEYRIGMRPGCIPIPSRMARSVRHVHVLRDGVCYGGSLRA
jgi:hypothetical protein